MRIAATMTTLRDNPTNPRWLRKALREIPREIGRIVEGFDDRMLHWRSAPGEWSALEVLGWIAEAEREDLLAVEAMIRYDGAAIWEQRAHLASLERDFNQESGWRLLDDFLSTREQLQWMLEYVDDQWQHRGEHPYRGAITLAKYLREMSDRDLEATIMLRRLADGADADFEPVLRERTTVVPIAP